MQQIERSTNRLWLGDFLRSRRERLLPQDYGFPVMRRRRSQGLRRDEVAQLAGISVAYYTWIEQGREINMSAEVLNAIARALDFNEAERAHLFALVGIEIAEDAARNDHVHPTLTQFFEDDSTQRCAFLYDAWFNVSQSTQLATAVFDIAPECSIESNLLYRLFADPNQRELWVDWESEAHLLVGMFRQSLALQPSAMDGFRLLDLLMGTPDFERIWSDYDVRLCPSPNEFFRPEPWQLAHPDLGSLRIHRLAMTLPGLRDRRLAMFSAADAETAQKWRAFFDDNAGRAAGYVSLAAVGT